MSQIDPLLLELEIPTPIEHIQNDQINLYLKREDQNHPSVQGNKWRKLKYNLLEYFKGDYKGIVSFGGVFSNHVYATAAACKILKIPCKLFLRGYTLDENNPTVQFIRESNAQIELLDPKAYRLKNKESFLDSLFDENYFIIPEGGTNKLGVKGVVELGHEILDQLSEAPDFVCVAAGTGGTAMGLIQAFANVKTKVLVFSSLKGDFLRDEIQDAVGDASFELITDSHFGGYGKFSKELISFCNQFNQNHNIQLDPVYTGKMMYGLAQLIKDDYFSPNDTVVAIHTGGLQGVAGFNYRYGEKLGRM